jgi:hypothetical protein
MRHPGYPINFSPSAAGRTKAMQLLFIAPNIFK